MSSLICSQALVNRNENELETITPRHYMQLHNGEEPYAYVATYRRALNCLSSFRCFEIYQISRTRMKAETLSWPSGCPSILHESVHKTVQRYKKTDNIQSGMGVFFLTMKKTPSFWLPTSGMRHKNRFFYLLLFQIM